MTLHLAAKSGLLALAFTLVLATPALANDTMTTEPSSTEPAQTYFDPTQQAQPPAPAQAVPGTYTGAVNMMNIATPAALTAKDVLKVSHQKGTNRGQYQGVELTLTNSQPFHVQIIHAEVLNGVDESIVAQEEAQRSQSKRRLVGGLLRGASSVPFMGGFGRGLGSVGAYQAAAIGSHVAHTTAGVIENSPGGAQYEGRYVRQVSSVIINPQQSWNFSTLVPKGQTPQLKMVFKNLETNQIFDLQQ